MIFPANKLKTMIEKNEIEITQEQIADYLAIFTELHLSKQIL